MTATSVPRANNSVALVLDRSGSMSEPAGGASTKTSLLKNAISVFNSLMLANDELALVSFDDLVATPAPMQAVSAATVPPVLAGTDLDPRGLTWIGGGIQQGFAQLALATHTNRSVLVLTDGVENVHPFVGELPAGTITSRTYAIGLGLPADISTTVLQQITSNTHGDLIITGEISTAEQSFNLTKYFLQMLAGVTNMNVLLDPQGALFFGSQDVIPFDVTDADIYVDVIALCPLPQLLDFTLTSPGGNIFNAGSGPNVEFVTGPQVAFYRVTLPALAADRAGSHAGTWKAILGLKSQTEIDKLLKKREFSAEFERTPVGESLPYSLIAHAYSNLKFEARLRQDSLKPGAVVTLEASLTTYGVPDTDAETVWAEVTWPDLTTVNLTLDRTADGLYATTFLASLPGVYPCRVRAEGYFRSKDRFTREKTLTAATYHGDYIAPRSNDALCDLLRCLTSDGVLTERAAEKLRELGIDLEALTRCLDRLCAKAEEHIWAKPNPIEVPKSAIKPGINIKSGPEAQPVERPIVEPMTSAVATVRSSPRIIHMFTRPEEAEPGVDITAQAMTQEAIPQAPPQVFPRIVRMFTHPDEVAVEEHEGEQ